MNEPNTSAGQHPRATHEISAVTFANGEAELTWHDFETGLNFGLTVKLTDIQCAKLAAVVPPCVYSMATVKLPSELAAENVTLRDAVRELRGALIGINHEGGCYCDAQYAMGGAHPRHAEECEAARRVLTKTERLV